MSKTKTPCAYEAAKENRREAWLPEVDERDERMLDRAWAKVGIAVSSTAHEETNSQKTAKDDSQPLTVK